ncbi:MAG: hypothetical protein ACSLE9_08945 [Burkholderiaceae bacterium]
MVTADKSVSPAGTWSMPSCREIVMPAASAAAGSGGYGYGDLVAARPGSDAQ